MDNDGQQPERIIKRLYMYECIQMGVAGAPNMPLSGLGRYAVTQTVFVIHHGRIQKGDMGSGPPSPKNQNNIGFLSNTCPDPLKNHKATKLAFNVGPSSAPPAKRHLNGVSLVGRYWLEFSAILILSPLTIKKNCHLHPLWQIFLDQRMINAVTSFPD